jgi:uncharacterized membrane protein YfcA
LIDQWLLVLTVGFLAGGLSALIGTGASLLLLPVLVPMFGAVEAIPIMAVAGFLANFSRVVAWWKQTDWRAVFAYSLPGIPAAVAGAYMLVHLPEGWPEMLLGAFIMLLVPLRRVVKHNLGTIHLPHLALSGTAIGFLTGLFLSTGPLSTPVFLAYGLVRGAFVATEAAASLVVQGAKIVSFHEFGVLPQEGLLNGVIVGVSLMLGTFASRPLLARISDHHFRMLLDVVTLISGLWLLIFGATR